MNVRLATQVLSGTMTNIMKKVDTILSDECQISYTSTKWNNDKHHEEGLTPYSVMNVRLATQVLSGTMTNIMKKFGSSHAAETAEFILGIDN